MSWRVGEYLRGLGVTPEEMYVEHGHMDEVFRAITLGGETRAGTGA